jgi:hypothetical protein
LIVVVGFILLTTYWDRVIVGGRKGLLEPCMEDVDDGNDDEEEVDVDGFLFGHWGE